MPWRTLCGFPPTSDTVTLRIPNGAWRPDTVITDYEGTEMFVLLDQTQEMRSYEAVFGDLEGRRLVCIKRHLIKAFWRDGYYFCTYKPNYKGQKPLAERDVDNKKVYPFSYLQVSPMKGRFFYRCFDNQEGLGPPRMRAENPWLGFMVVCCTPMVRSGRWTASFKRKSSAVPTIHVDQWRNCVDVGPGNDLLAALCMAYVFDRYQCQPLVTVFGMDDEQLEADDRSIASQEDVEKQQGTVKLDNVPGSVYRDHPDGYEAHEPVDEFGNPLPTAYDEFGNPVDHPKSSAVAYDEFGNPIDQPAYDEFGNPIDQPAYDEFGNPIEQPQPAFDEFGNPIDQQQQPAFDEFGNPLPGHDQQPAYDEFGNHIERQQPAFDEFGNPLPDHDQQPAYDEFGNPMPIYDEQPAYNEFGDQIDPEFDPNNDDYLQQQGAYNPEDHDGYDVDPNNQVLYDQDQAAYDPQSDLLGEEPLQHCVEEQQRGQENYDDDDDESQPKIV